MIAATHYENLLVLLFFGLAALFQWLTAAASKKRKRPDETRPRSPSPSQTSGPLETEEEDTDEDRIRKFLEALGQPTTSKPPPPVEQRPTYQKPIVVPRTEPDIARRRWVSQPLPPLTTRPPDLPEQSDLPREVRLPQQIPPIRRAKKFRPFTPEAPSEVQPGSEPPKTAEPITTPSEAYAVVTKPAEAKGVSAKSDFATLLRSASGLRDAIILREIFGPPRSMQPLDLVGNV